MSLEQLQTLVTDIKSGVLDMVVATTG